MRAHPPQLDVSAKHGGSLAEGLRAPLTSAKSPKALLTPPPIKPMVTHFGIPDRTVLDIPQHHHQAFMIRYDRPKRESSTPLESSRTRL